MKKVLKIILLGIFVIVLLIIGYFFIGSAPTQKEIQWGVNFSQQHAESLGLDWKETYLALMDDLGAKRIKLITQWDLIEPEKDKYIFDDLDWQLKKAGDRGAEVLLVIGMKTGRWPECHEPSWVRTQNSKLKTQNLLLEYIKKIVERYKNSEAIWAWQVENEPFFPFGECPWADKEFLKKEIDLVKSLDPARPVVVSDSGELSFWITAAEMGDIVGTTLHRKVWFKKFNNYIQYPLRPVFYWRKAQIIERIFGKEVIGIELQVEPWCPTLLYNCSLEEQQKTMDLDKFQKNIQFAEQTGLKEFYLWGAEWAYWLKVKQNQPEIWDEAKKLFQ